MHVLTFMDGCIDSKINDEYKSYIFRINAQNYHRISSYNPSEGQLESFA